MPPHSCVQNTAMGTLDAGTFCWGEGLSFFVFCFESDSLRRYQTLRMLKFGSYVKKTAKEATSPNLTYLDLAPRYTLILWSSCQPRSDEGHF